MGALRLTRDGQELLTIPVTRAGSGMRPYDPASPWNTPIPPDIPVDPRSGALIAAIADNGMPLTCDPDQYTIPVVTVTAATPLRTVRGTGFYSSYDAGDNSRAGHGSPWTAQIPIPDDAPIGVGSDGQLEIVNSSDGAQWGFWQLARQPDGSYTCTNAYRYHTTAGYMGRFADGRAGRGAGTPYLAGLVRPWEIQQGRIDHALAFAYHAPSPEFRYPASKSDGGGFGGITGTDVPEGARLQLDPALTDADFARWGLTPAARTIARALQVYGMYVIDNSGSSKIYLEDRTTARWGAEITRSLVSAIPWAAFRVVAAPA